MTQTGQVTLYDWDETTLGQIPSGPAPTGRAVRFTSGNFKVLPTLSESAEVTAGNEPRDAIITGYEGGGDLGFEFSAVNYDRFFAGLLWNTWAYQTGNSGNRVIRASGTAQVTYVAATRTLTTAGTWTVTPAEGDQILVQGSGNAYLDGIHKIEGTPTSTAIVLEQDGILSDTAKVPNIASARNIVIVRGERVTNSLTPTQVSFGFEQQIERTRGKFLGVTATAGSTTVDYSQFLAVMPTRIQMQSTGDASWTGQLSLRSSREQDSSEADGSTTVMAGTTASSDTAIFQGINSVKKCRFYFPDMSATAGDAGKIEDTMRICPQSLALEFSNNLQVTPLMCAEAEFDYQQGEPLAQATVVGIYETPYPLVAFNEQYAGVFEVALVSTDGYGYLFRYPRAKMTLARADVGGRAQTLVCNMTVKAFAQVDAPATGDSSRAVEIYRFIPAA